VSSKVQNGWWSTRQASIFHIYSIVCMLYGVFDIIYFVSLHILFSFSFSILFYIFYIEIEVIVGNVQYYISNAMSMYFKKPPWDLSRQL
jgi:hypothetical protein